MVGINNNLFNCCHSAYTQYEGIFDTLRGIWYSYEYSFHSVLLANIIYILQYNTLSFKVLCQPLYHIGSIVLKPAFTVYVTSLEMVGMSLTARQIVHITNSMIIIA